jgi:phosphorylase kinase alpha/beta subunit
MTRDPEATTDDRPTGADLGVETSARAQLDQWFAHAEIVFLSRLTPGAGLLPASTARTVHGDYSHAWTRDNVYSVMGLWALSCACRRHDPTPERADRLAQAVRKVMRGLLVAMMGQADKVERFKHTQNPLHGLHAKYDADTGAPVVEDDGWGHLQIDATSLFLLQLAQFTAAGLVILENRRETLFVQSLTYYIGAAYRTADYGIWERGRKTNDGQVEVNCSSVGMAKAALGAIGQVNLLGPDAGDEGRVHVPPDDAARARETLHALLPMESLSKEVDAALLSVIGWPAWAVEDADLANRTRAKIMDTLMGRHGAKRFLRDGHQTAVEDHDRLHYQAGELAKFAHIESEWPLFMTFAMAESGLRGDPVETAMWSEKLEGLLVERDGQRLLPELYIVPADRIEAERADPGSQPRVPNENVPLLWAQSQWMMADLLAKGLTLPDDIDPLGRRRRVGMAADANVQICLLAADEAAYDGLVTLGGPVSRLAEVGEQVRVISAGDLVRAWSRLGACPELGLTGRSERRMGPLAAAQIYRTQDRPCIVSPTLLEAHDHHIRHDGASRARRIRGDLRYVARHWLKGSAADHQQPVFAITLDGLALEGCGADKVWALLRDIAAGEVDGEAVTLVRLADILTQPPGPLIDPGSDQLAEPGPVEPFGDLCEAEALIDRAHRDFVPEDALEAAYLAVARAGRWRPTRAAAALLTRFDPRLADAAKDLTVRMRRLDLGGQIVTRPPSERDIIQALNAVVGVASAESVLAQEALLALGLSIKSDLMPFKGVRTVRLIEILGRLSGEEPGGMVALSELPPSAISERVQGLLDRTPGVRDVIGAAPDFPLQAKAALVEGQWRAWRERLGVLTRVRSDFYARIWSLLHVCNGLQFGEPGDAAGRIDAAIARADWTAWERDFGLVIETRLERISSPAYRTFCLEALNVLAARHEAEPDWRHDGDIALDRLIHGAVDLVWGRAKTPTPRDQAWAMALAARPDVMARALALSCDALATGKADATVGA